MTTEDAWGAREVLVIRELLERAELRELCLQALSTRTQAGAFAPALPLAGRRAGAGEQDTVR